MNTNYCGSCIIDIEDCDPLIIKTKNNNKNKMKIICFMFIILSCISFSLVSTKFIEYIKIIIIFLFLFTTE
ncbi:unnamed protein product [Aphis gossypii]|uniref:Uncharacterized protein n=1 Tax=Aphis gossypii TaxID=80765 RepID=A0A9P0NSA3_APHGO|nr:unnamed protein product [Aphis gossypii]